MGLDETLRARRPGAPTDPRFFGILNGLDTELWDPATDADLAAPLLDAADLAGKAACRADLLPATGSTRTIRRRSSG